MALSHTTRPIFPPEIWPTVFSNFEDDGLVHLWLDCRHVCRQFRDDVERLFSKRYLPKTTIIFDFGIWYSQNPDAFGGKVNGFSFGFSHLANEGTLSVFKPKACPEELLPPIMQCVSRCISDSTIRSPRQMVCFCRGINDTELPELSINEETREISINWRAMLSQFLAELKLKRCYLAQNIDALIRSPKFQELRDKHDGGEANHAQTMKANFAMCALESTKSARRARLRRQREAQGYTRDLDPSFENAEHMALRGMKIFQPFANWDVSDDEHEEEPKLESRRNEGTSNERDSEELENTNLRRKLKYSRRLMRQELRRKANSALIFDETDNMGSGTVFTR